MSKSLSRGEQIRRFILRNVEKHPKDIAKVTASKFTISRQGVNKHLRNLVKQGFIDKKGATRNLEYHLPVLVEWSKGYELELIEEDIVWRNDIEPLLGQMSSNVIDIWHYGFTEMLNNAIDHSEGIAVIISVEKTASSAEIMIYDDGIGIFKKIKEKLGLLDERHALFELAKGKLTTDPDNHTGEGIFFASRMFDDFAIMAGDTYFTHEYGEEEDWFIDHPQKNPGTSVFMKLSNYTSRTVKKIFDSYSTDDDFGFTKTVIPVALAQYGNDRLVSRSQAKRILARVEMFRTVVLNFKGVDSIGQAFADEIFRVFANKHPEIELVPIHASSAVKRIILRSVAK